MSDKNIDKDKQIIQYNIYDDREKKVHYIDISGEDCYEFLDAIENVLSELEIKNKMIDLLIDKLFDLDYEHNFQKVICDYIPKAKCDTYEDDKCDICVKEYIRNEVLKDE